MKEETTDRDIEITTNAQKLAPLGLIL